MRVVMIRTNGVNPDPRVEKEVNSIIKDGKHSVTVLAWDRENDSDSDGELLLTNGRARIIRFGVPSEWGGGFKKNLVPLIQFSKAVHGWLKKHEAEYDCIHCCDLPTAMMASPYIKKKKFVYDIYDYFADTAHAPEFVLNYARKKEKQMIEMADATILCSEQREKQIGDARPKKLVVIHNSPDSSLLETVKENNKHVVKSNNSKIKLVYVGNLIEERFIDRIAEIVSHDDRIEFHVGGVGPLSVKMEDYSKRFSNIYFYGRMKYQDVICLESDCDILLALYDPTVLNNQYAAPNKFYEALLVEKPLIMIKNTGMDYVVQKEKIGSVSDSAREGDLKSAIQKAIDLLNSDNSIGTRMKDLYYDRYSWSIMERRVISLYETL